MRRLLILASLVGSLALSAQAASAGTVGFNPWEFSLKPGPGSERIIAFRAFAGETNDVTLRIETPVGRSFFDVIVTDSANPVTAGAGCVAVSANSASCPLSYDDPRYQQGAQVDVVFHLFDMADEFSTGSMGECGPDPELLWCAVGVDGGPGVDTLVAATVTDEPFNAHLRGGDGDDVLVGDSRFRTATLEGGPGADTLQDGIAGYRDRGSSVSVTLNGERDDGEPGEMDLAGAGVRGAYGGSGDDLLVGNAGENHLDGGAGSDRLRGGPGNDTVEGGADGDRLYGDRGRDRLRGDAPFGGAGDDFLFGGRGADFVNGQGGRDVMTGGRGPDTLVGGADNDVFYARDAYADRLRGGRGWDRARIDRGLDRTRGIERRL